MSYSATHKGKVKAWVKHEYELHTQTHKSMSYSATHKGKNLKDVKIKISPICKLCC